MVATGGIPFVEDKCAGSCTKVVGANTKPRCRSSAKHTLHTDTHIYGANRALETNT